MIIKYKKGLPHLVNSPAIIWDDGVWDWLLDGKQHRYYGPQNNYGNWWIHQLRIK